LPARAQLVQTNKDDEEKSPPVSKLTSVHAPAKQSRQLWRLALSILQRYNPPLHLSLQISCNLEVLDPDSLSKTIPGQMDIIQRFNQQSEPEFKIYTGRILDILTVMRDTLGFDDGALIWRVFCCAVEFIIKPRNASALAYSTKSLSQLSEILSMIARYTVMESIYAQWVGMSLSSEYEDSLISLSMCIFEYLGSVLSGSDDGIEKVIGAEEKCRGFKVIVDVESKENGIKRKAEEMESSDSDESGSGATLIEQIGGGKEEDRLRVKRIKV